MAGHLGVLPRCFTAKQLSACQALTQGDFLSDDDSEYFADLVGVDGPFAAITFAAFNHVE